MHVPPGLNTVTVYFFVDRSDQFLSFLVDGLGGVEILRQMIGPRIANAQVASAISP